MTLRVTPRRPVVMQPVAKMRQRDGVTVTISRKTPESWKAFLYWNVKLDAD